MAEKAPSTRANDPAPDPYREEMDKLKNDIGKLQSDVSELVNLLKDSAADKGTDIKGKVSREGERIFDEVMARLDESVTRGKKTVDDVGEQISEHPVSALFITFGLGYILAKLTEHGGGGSAKPD